MIGGTPPADLGPARGGPGAGSAGGHGDALARAQPAGTARRILSYDVTTADGTIIRNGRLEFPRAEHCRIDGDSIHFLTPDSDEVAFTWTLLCDDIAKATQEEP